MSHVNGFPVTEVTEQEWRDSNAQYTPSQDVIDKLLAT
jgi:hypothetical protein